MTRALPDIDGIRRLVLADGAFERGCVLLLGSVARSDFVPGLSDIDVAYVTLPGAYDSACDHSVGVTRRIHLHFRMQPGIRIFRADELTTSPMPVGGAKVVDGLMAVGVDAHIMCGKSPLSLSSLSLVDVIESGARDAMKVVTELSMRCDDYNFMSDRHCYRIIKQVVNMCRMLARLHSAEFPLTSRAILDAGREKGWYQPETISLLEFVVWYRNSLRGSAPSGSDLATVRMHGPTGRIVSQVFHREHTVLLELLRGIDQGTS